MSEIGRPILRDETSPALLHLDQIAEFLVKVFMFLSKRTSKQMKSHSWNQKP